MLNASVGAAMRQLAIASLFLNLAPIGLAAGCASSPIPQIPPSVELKDLPVTVNRNVDLLFLVDDSPSMGDKQTNLAANFPRFIAVLDTIPGGLPNVHIGVATSDLGTKGAEDQTAGPGIGTLGAGGCSGLGKNGNMQVFGAPVSGGLFLSDTGQPDGSRLKNYTGNLVDVFATMAKAGAGGCGFEQHLEAIKQALGPANQANQGFLRPDAYLAVIIIADEDDCSIAHSSLFTANETGPLGPLESFRCTRFGVLCDDGGATTDAMNEVGPKAKCHPADDSAYLTKVSDYGHFLKGLKTDPNNVLVAGIMGTTSPFSVELRAPPATTAAIPALAHSCTYIGGDGKPELADPPIRLKAFLDQFPNRNAFAPICQQDLSGGLQQIADLLKAIILGDPCIEGTLADLDPKTPGQQVGCDVSVVTGRGSPSESTAALARCTPEDSSASNPPCWRLATDAMTCPNSDHVGLKVEGLATLPGDAHVIASCSVNPTP
jgi:hypothetical protein